MGDFSNKDHLRITTGVRYGRNFVFRAADGSAGDITYAEETLARLEQKRREDYISPVELATLNIALGRNQDALDWIDKAFEERRGWLAYLNVHPVVDPLREEPRFKQMIEKMGLSPGGAS